MRGSLYHTLSLLAWMSLPGAASAAPQGLIHTLVSSYPKGEQLSLEVVQTPNGDRGFLAEGATIAMLDLSGPAPVEIDTHALPECQPLALRHYLAGSGTHYLFVAGGAFGVYRLTLCQGLFNQPPTNCLPASSYADFRLQDPIQDAAFERKRCVDVAILENSTPPVLFALFAASSDSGCRPAPSRSEQEQRHN